MLGPQFEFLKANTKDMDTKRHTHKLEAYDEDFGDFTGVMEWHPKTGELKNIYVEPNYRRQGIATALWSEGRKIAQSQKGVVAPQHSSDRTDEGDAWAQSTGDRLPQRKSAPTHNW